MATFQIARNATKCQSIVPKFPVNFYSCRLRLAAAAASQSDAVKVLNNFRTIPQFDRRIGAYSCDIQLITNIEEVIVTAKNIEIIFELEAALVGSGISDVVTLKLIPAIKVVPLSIAIEQLATQMITVSGLDKVLQMIQVKSSHPTVLEVVAVSKVPGTWQYRATLIDSIPDEAVQVHIVSPLSQQNIDVTIGTPSVVMLNGKCSGGGTPPSWQSVGSMFVNMVSNIGLIISALITLAVAIWGEYFMLCIYIWILL